MRIVACGILRHSSLSLVGSYVEESFKKFNIKNLLYQLRLYLLKQGLQT
nr:hypothetical protein [Clostridium sporogenes]